MDGSREKLCYIRSRSIVLPIFQAKHYHYQFFNGKQTVTTVCFFNQLVPFGWRITRLITGLSNTHRPMYCLIHNYCSAEKFPAHNRFTGNP